MASNCLFAKNKIDQFLELKLIKQIEIHAYNDQNLAHFNHFRTGCWLNNNHLNLNLSNRVLNNRTMRTWAVIRVKSLCLELNPAVTHRSLDKALNNLNHQETSIFLTFQRIHLKLTKLRKSCMIPRISLNNKWLLI